MSLFLRPYLGRLNIYTGIPPTLALTEVLEKIIVELLSSLALATKQVEEGGYSEFFPFLYYA
jgi:hypothetical protein